MEKGSVLVVDDNEAVLQLLTEFLSGEGFAVQAASSARQALERMEAAPCDIVICDYSMPGGVSGAELAGLLRARYPRLFIIGISGNCDEEHFLTSGAHLFLAKPFRLQDLLSSLDSR